MNRKMMTLPILAVAMLASVASSQIVVESSLSQGFGTIAAVDQAAPWTVTGFDAGAGDKLVVSVSMEGDSVGSDFVVTFGGTALTQIVTSNDASTVESTAIFYLDGVSGVGDVVVEAGAPTNNGPAVYIAALSGAATGVETSGAFGDGETLDGTLTGTLTGVSAGAYTIAHFADQGNSGVIVVTGDLVQVGVYNASFAETGNEIGSAIAATATGFGTGSDLTVGFSDNGNDTPFQSRSNFTWASFTASPGSPVILGDVNMDGTVDFLDISPFIAVLSSGGAQPEADVNQDTVVDFLDISPFIAILSGSGS